MQLLLRTDVRVISERIKEAREALGLSQQALADRLGVSLRSQQNYEAGMRVPDAVYLAGIAAAGADVLFILTGQRSQSIDPVRELPRQEQAWLEIYRNSSDSVRAALKAAGDELTKPARKKNKAA